MANAFRCDICNELIEDEVAVLHPSELNGYGDKCGVRIKVFISGQGPTHSYVCESCVVEETQCFLTRQWPKTGST